MTSFEPVQAGPYLAPSDPPDLANISKAVVDWAATRIVMRFASAAARAAAVPTPVEGMVSWLNDTNQLYVHNGTGWVLVSALDNTGWITATLGSGWTGAAGELPAYRRLNGITYLNGRATSTGATATAFTLPPTFRPNIQAVVSITDTSGVLTRSVVTPAGAVTQITTAAVTLWSIGSIRPFPADA